MPPAPKDTRFSGKQIEVKNLNMRKQDWHQFSRSTEIYKPIKHSKNVLVMNIRKTCTFRHGRRKGGGREGLFPL